MYFTRDEPKINNTKSAIVPIHKKKRKLDGFLLKWERKKSSCQHRKATLKDYIVTGETVISVVNIKESKYSGFSFCF